MSSFYSIDTFPNKENIEVKEENDEIIINTAGLRTCKFFQFKILISFTRLNLGMDTKETTFKENQRKRDLGEEIIDLGKIKVCDKYKRIEKKFEKF